MKKAIKSRRSPRAWLPAMMIAAAALIAHGGCLHSTFYLDDFDQIVRSDEVDHGFWYLTGLRRLTYLTYWFTWRAAGMSAPAFHLGNLLLHAATAIAVAGFARDYLREAGGRSVADATRIAFWAGLLFAVHPLCSEVTNYVRARDIELVSFFSMLAAWAVVRWRAGGWMAWGWGIGAGGAIAAASFSKEVGAIIAGGSAALIGLGALRAPRHRKSVFLMAGAAIALLALSLRLQTTLFRTLLRSAQDPRFSWHALTQTRVFWMYAQRVILPVWLCSDHLIAWTRTASDAAAWFALAGVLAVIALTAWACAQRSWRAVGILGALALLAILHRLANVSAELMVEYRMYPAMMWLCVLLAWGFDRAWRPSPSSDRARVAVGAGLIGLCVILCALRTLDWRSSQTLCANIVAQYPLQARAMEEEQEGDLRAENWSRAVEMQTKIRATLEATVESNRTHPARAYSIDKLSVVHVLTEGNCALGLAHLGRYDDALALCAWLRRSIDQHGLTHPFYLASFHYSRGLVYEASAQIDEALTDLRESCRTSATQDYMRRDLRRLEATVGQSSPEDFAPH